MKNKKCHFCELWHGFPRTTQKRECIYKYISGTDESSSASCCIELDVDGITTAAKSVCSAGSADRARLGCPVEL